MKMTDSDLAELIHSVLRRCPEGNDDYVVEQLVNAIIEVEILELGQLKVI